MTWLLGLPLTVALIAAAASIAGAVSARRSADDIDRRRHVVLSLDDERRTFNEAFARLMAAAGVVKGPDGAREFMFAAQPLLVHPRADRAVRESAVAVTNLVAAIVSKRADGFGLTDSMAELTTAVRAVNDSIAKERASAVRDASQSRRSLFRSGR